MTAYYNENDPACCTECERLMNFPDGWTNNGQSDSARYKQLGNSVVVSVVEWIARRLRKVCEE